MIKINALYFEDDTYKKWVSVIHKEVNPVLDSITDQSLITRIQDTLKFLEDKLDKENPFPEFGSNSLP